jgi:hypothetical protein
LAPITPDHRITRASPNLHAQPLGREQVRHKSGRHCHICGNQISGYDGQFDLVVPLSMGDEVWC